MREIADGSTSLSGVGRRSSIISLTHVNVSLNGHRVLHDISWELKHGENWAVLGANGAGKSTLLRLLRGEIWPAPVNGGTRTYCLDGATPTHSPIGVKEQIIFPEIDIDKVSKITGMDISFVTNAKTDAEAFALLKELGLPFKNQKN